MMCVGYLTLAELAKDDTRIDASRGRLVTIHVGGDVVHTLNCGSARVYVYSLTLCVCIRYALCEAFSLFIPL